MEIILYYFYVLIIPILIIIAGYILKVPKPKSFFDYLRFFIGIIPFFFGYSFIIYLLEDKKVLGSGWAFYSFMFFLLPVSFVALSLYLFISFKKNRSKGK